MMVCYRTSKQTNTLLGYQSHRLTKGHPPREGCPCPFRVGLRAGHRRVAPAEGSAEAPVSEEETASAAAHEGRLQCDVPTDVRTDAVPTVAGQELSGPRPSARPAGARPQLPTSACAADPHHRRGRLGPCLVRQGPTATACLPPWL